MKKLLCILDKIERFLIVLAFSVMTVTIFVQVINRNITHVSVGWFEELARYCMITVIMFASEIVFRTNEHMRLQIIVDKLKGKARVIVERLVHVLIIFFSVVIMSGSFSLIKAVAKSGQKTAGLQIPMAVPYLAVLIPFSIITLIQIVQFITAGSKAAEKEEN